jgi:hypothetical protein
MKRASASGGPERPPRPWWFDARFAIGLALVVASVAGVVGLVSSSDETISVWAARTAISPGDTVGVDDLREERVRLGDASDRYLGGDDLPDAGVVVTRAIASGELIPTSAIGSVEGVRVAAVVVGVDGRLPASVGPGTTVDLWSAAEIEGGRYGSPSILVGSATVVRVIESDGLIVDGAETGVEVMVPKAAVAGVLEAVANANAISLVPVSIPVGD